MATSAKTAAIKAKKVKEKRSFIEEFKKHWMLYVMILPGILYFLVFKYAPMGGLVIAFQDYFSFLGIRGSEWVGLKHFIRFFSDDSFPMLMRNTLSLFGLNLLFSFPFSILLALMLNEVRSTGFKKGVQTLVYLPHFMSWVIVYSVFYVLLTTEGGTVNALLESWGIERIFFMTSPKWLPPMYVLQNIWKTAGWGSIIYLAALTNVDEQLYEASEIDGAGRLRQMWHITLPSIRPTIVTMLILRIGDVLDLGFDHMFLLLNPLNREVAEIFDTYVYTAGIKNGQMSYAAAVGLFKSLIGLVLVIVANKVAKKAGEDGVY